MRLRAGGRAALQPLSHRAYPILAYERLAASVQILSGQMQSELLQRRQGLQDGRQYGDRIGTGGVADRGIRVGGGGQGRVDHRRQIFRRIGFHGVERRTETFADRRVRHAGIAIQGVLRQRGLEGPGHQARHANPEAAGFNVQCCGCRIERMLAGRIGRHQRRLQDRGDRSDVDDAAGALLAA